MTILGHQTHSRRNHIAELVATLSGLEYRVNDRELPGAPDLVFPSERLAVFVHGCFWHRHHGCPRATTPRTNRHFWETKFRTNRRRDRAARRRLLRMGWAVEVVWECEL
jgi:DNA mismatch endonuclease (patch repair protein)